MGRLYQLQWSNFDKKYYIMKKICFVLLSVVGISFCGQSKVLTVSNNTNSPGQYTDLQAACDAAVSNDTIYIHASEKDYGSIYIRKRLVLFGEGTLPNQQILLRAYVSSITFSHALESISTITSAGSQVYGLHAQFFVGTNKENVGLSGFTFHRCKGLISSLGGSYSVSNLEINQFVGSINLGARLSNSVISNSILSIIGWIESDVYGLKSSNNIIRNSILGNNCTIYGAVVSNNIFYDPAVNQNIVTKNSTYTNNLFVYKTTSFLVNGTTTSTGNIVNQDPMFVNPESLPSIVTQYSFETQGPHANFTLSAGSPALTLGTDGTQAGLYGGPTPWVDGGEGVFRYGTMPSQVPYVTDMDILNTAVPLNGTLNVKIKAKTQQ